MEISYPDGQHQQQFTGGAFRILPGNPFQGGFLRRVLEKPFENGDFVLPQIAFKRRKSANILCKCGKLAGQQF